LIDEAAGTDSRPVSIAQKRFRLFLDGEDTTGFLTLPLARVRLDGSGHFIFDAEFIPPSLQVGASPSLTGLLGGLIEILSSRADALIRASEGRGDEELGSRWMAYAINENLGTLLHLYRSPEAHPSELFAVLLKLAGALCTFSLTTHPRDLPPYDHAGPGDGF